MDTRTIDELWEDIQRTVTEISEESEPPLGPTEPEESPTIIDTSLHTMLQNRVPREFETSSEFHAHHNLVRSLIIEELKSKHKFRKISYWLVMGIALSLLIFIYLFIFFKSATASLPLLITLTVSVFANLIALIGVIFKYVFSSTKEITDYASILSDHERTK